MVVLQGLMPERQKWPRCAGGPHNGDGGWLGMHAAGLYRSQNGNRPEPRRGHDGGRIQGVAQRFANRLEAVQGSYRGRGRRRIGPLAASGPDQLAVAAPREQGLEEERLRRTRDEVGAKLTEERGIEARVRECQAQHILSVEATPRRACDLAIGEPFRTLQHGHGGEPPRGPSGLAVLGEGGLKGRIPEEGMQCISKRGYRCPLGNAARATRTVSGGRGSVGIGRHIGHLHVYGRNFLRRRWIVPVLK